MVFKRRDTPPLLHRLRDALAPPGGWRRGVAYLGHRVRRLPDTPHRIALGFALGVFLSFTPFFGLHFLLAIVLARLLRANALAAFVGTFAGNPLTFPLIASISLALGRRILGHGVSGRDFSRITDAFLQFLVGLWQGLRALAGGPVPEWDRLALLLGEVLWPYFVGGLLPGLVAAITSYYVICPLIAGYQAARRARLMARALARLRGGAGRSATPGYTGADPTPDLPAHPTFDPPAGPTPDLPAHPTLDPPADPNSDPTAGPTVHPHADPGPPGRD